MAGTITAALLGVVAWSDSRDGGGSMAKTFAVIVSGPVGCTPSTVTPASGPDVDAAPLVLADGETPCAAACAALAAIGCADGVSSSCVTVLAHVDGARLTRTPSGAALTCVAVAGAHSRADLAALGVSCTDAGTP